MNVVLISRCAWHRRYYGYTRLLGISSWRGLQVSFTDGICQKCAARVRADHLRARFDRGASADQRDTAWAPGLAAVSLAVVVALVLVARPTHELPVPPVVSLLPAASPAAEPAAQVAEKPQTPVDAPPAAARRVRAARPPLPSVPESWVPVNRDPRVARREVASARLSALPRTVAYSGPTHGTRRSPSSQQITQSP
jgi:hypothetical protein